MNVQPIVEIIVSALLLAVSAEILVRTASALALHLGVSPIFVGLTVVGFGTSAPELSSSLSATLRGIPDISVSNIVGSNIFNIGVILGLTAVLRPIPISYTRVKTDLTVALAAGFVPVLAFFIGTSGERVVGSISLAALLTYIYFAYRRDTNTELVSQVQARSDVGKSLFLTQPTHTTVIRVVIQFFVIIASLVVLILSSSHFVGGGHRNRTYSRCL